MRGLIRGRKTRTTIPVPVAIDLFSRAIVGWSASTTTDVAFVEWCLSMALWRRDHTGRPVTAGMIHHWDAGSRIYL
jgi:putative transposase